MSSYDYEYMASIELTGLPWAIHGYAIADGSLIPMSQNNALATLLGTNFGGDGMTTFGLPDLRSRLPIGAGQGQNLSTYVLGEELGSEETRLTGANMAPHTHEVSLGGSGGAGAYATAGGSTGTPGGQGAFTAMSGEGLPFSNLPPVLAVSYQIAITGIFPMRD